MTVEDRSKYILGEYETMDEIQRLAYEKADSVFCETAWGTRGFEAELEEAHDDLLRELEDHPFIISGRGEIISNTFFQYVDQLKVMEKFLQSCAAAAWYIRWNSGEVGNGTPLQENEFPFNEMFDTVDEFIEQLVRDMRARFKLEYLPKPFIMDLEKDSEWGYRWTDDGHKYEKPDAGQNGESHLD